MTEKSKLKERLAWRQCEAGHGRLNIDRPLEFAAERPRSGHVGRIAQSPPSHTLSSSSNCPRRPLSLALPAPSHATLLLSLGMTDNMGRRRSVDVGGLALALSDERRGHGWGGWEETDCGETRCVTCSDQRRHSCQRRTSLQICRGSDRCPSAHRDYRQPGG